ncbi:MAG: aspartate/glutamate racemase family protein [Candidatus Bathyarchaeia archaeon]
MVGRTKNTRSEGGLDFKRVMVIVPIKGLTEEGLEERKSFARSMLSEGTTADFVVVERGPPAIESRVDAEEAIPDVLTLAKKAEGEGYDAAIVWCASDPGVDAARELVDIPVIGPGEASRAIASILGKRVARINPEIPVLEMRRDLDKTVVEIRGLAMEAVEREGADAFVLGCLALWGLGRRLREETGLPVVDPAEASLKMAEVAIALNLRHSRLTYPRYPPPHRRSPDRPEKA